MDDELDVLWLLPFLELLEDVFLRPTVGDNFGTVGSNGADGAARVTRRLDGDLSRAVLVLDEDDEPVSHEEDESRGRTVVTRGSAKLTRLSLSPVDFDGDEHRLDLIPLVTVVVPIS